MNYREPVEETTEEEQYAAWRFNCDALLFEILVWKEKYIQEQKKKNPLISQEELIKKIKKAKYKRFKDSAYFLISSNPSINCL